MRLDIILPDPSRVSAAPFVRGLGPGGALGAVRPPPPAPLPRFKIPSSPSCKKERELWRSLRGEGVEKCKTYIHVSSYMYHIFMVYARGRWTPRAPWARADGPPGPRASGTWGLKDAGPRGRLGPRSSTGLGFSMEWSKESVREKFGEDLGIAPGVVWKTMSPTPFFGAENYESHPLFGGKSDSWIFLRQ